MSAIRRRGSEASRPAPVELAELGDLGRVRAFLVLARDLEVDGQVLEARMREEGAEALAELALEDVRVAIAVRAERRRGGVHVQRAQPGEPDARVDTAREPRGASGAGQVGARQG